MRGFSFNMERKKENVKPRKKDNQEFRVLEIEAREIM